MPQTTTTTTTSMSKSAKRRQRQQRQARVDQNRKVTTVTTRNTRTKPKRSNNNKKRGMNPYSMTLIDPCHHPGIKIPDNKTGWTATFAGISTLLKSSADLKTSVYGLVYFPQWGFIASVNGNAGGVISYEIIPANYLAAAATNIRMWRVVSGCTEFTSYSNANGNQGMAVAFTIKCRAPPVDNAAPDVNIIGQLPTNLTDALALRGSRVLPLKLGITQLFMPFDEGDCEFISVNSNPINFFKVNPGQELIGLGVLLSGADAANFSGRFNCQANYESIPYQGSIIETTPSSVNPEWSTSAARLLETSTMNVSGTSESNTMSDTLAKLGAGLAVAGGAVGAASWRYLQIPRRGGRGNDRILNDQIFGV